MRRLIVKTAEDAGGRGAFEFGVDEIRDRRLAARAEAERELAYLSSHDPEFSRVEARLEEAVAMINVHR